MRTRTLFYVAGSMLFLILLLFAMAPGIPAMSIPGGRQGQGPNTTFDSSIIDFAFQPASLTIHIGDTVTWTNNGAANHTTTSNTLVWDSGVITPGNSFSFMFTQTGVFPYHCTIHPSMTGTITVVDLTTPLPTNTPTASRTPTNTPTSTRTPTNTSTSTRTPTNTPTPTVKLSETLTESITPTPTGEQSATPTESETPTPTVEQSPTPTGSETLTPTPTLAVTPGTLRSIYIPLVLELP